MEMSRESLAEQISNRLRDQAETLARQWERSAPINHFVLDDVLPEESARKIRAAFPAPATMMLRRNLRELKYVAAQMDRYDPLLEEAVFAFQRADIVGLVERITGLRALEPDHLLYAGGISLMARGHFLNPHLDNSHDKFRNRYRVLNLLYYVSPDWSEGHGGNLEIWPEGPRRPPITIVSKYNRLVAMVTHPGSWHSVSASVVPHARCCVSNYYFSKHPVGRDDYFHVTSFRGRPEQPVRDLVLRADTKARMLLRKIFRGGVVANPHYYKKDE